MLIHSIDFLWPDLYYFLNIMQRVLFFILSWKLKCAAHTDPSFTLYAHASRSIPSLFSVSLSIRRIKSGANIPRTTVLRGRTEKKGSRRTILTTKAAELLIRQFLCTHRAAQRRGIHEDIKLTILYRHHRPIGRFSDSCQYRLLGGFLTRQ